MMVRIGLRLHMADSAGKYREVTRIRMAVAAGIPCTGMGPGIYGEIGMRYAGSGPSGCRMALGAVVRKSSCDMSRIRGGGIRRGMARIAIGRQTSILPAAVAIRALQSRMRASQRKSRRAVAEGSLHPRNG